MKKSLALLVLSSLMAVFLGGCGMPSILVHADASLATDSPEVIRLLHTWPEHDQLFEDLARAAVNNGNGYSLRVLSVSGAEAQDYIRTSVAADSMADILAADQRTMRFFIDQGYAVMLQTLDLELDAYWQNGLDTFSDADGRLYALPAMADGALLAINENIFEEQGWKIPENPDELEYYLRQAKQKEYIPLAVSSKPDGGSIYRLYLSLSGQALQCEGVQGREQMENWNGALAKSATKIKGWYKEGYFGDNLFSTNTDLVQVLFLQGRAPVAFVSAAQAAALAEQADMRVKIVPLPVEQAEKQLGTPTDLSFGGIALYVGSGNKKLVRAANDLSCAIAETDAAKGLGMVPVRALGAGGQIAGVSDVQGILALEERVALEPMERDADLLQQQLFMEYLTSSMTGDRFESNVAALLK